MNKKSLTTFEREMQNEGFREDFEKGYKEFTLSEILMDLMEENHKTVRDLAHETRLSPTTIQNWQRKCIRK